MPVRQACSVRRELCNAVGNCKLNRGCRAERVSTGLRGFSFCVWSLCFPYCSGMHVTMAVSHHVVVPLAHFIFPTSSFIFLEFPSARVSILFTLGTSILWVMTTRIFLGDRFVCDDQSTNQSLKDPTDSARPRDVYRTHLCSCYL